MSTFSSQNLSELAIVLSGVCLLLLIYVWWSMRNLNKLRSTFFAGQNGADLEATLHALSDQLSTMQEQQLTLENGLVTLHSDFQFAVQKIGVVRFNPFADGGGNFSF